MLWQSATDPQAWLIFVIVIATSVPNGAVSSFQSILISGFGFTDKETVLLKIPGGVISVASVLLATWLASKYNERCLDIIFWAAAEGSSVAVSWRFFPRVTRSAR